MGLIFNDKDFAHFDRKWKEQPKRKGGFIVRLTWAGLEKFGVKTAAWLGDRKWRKKRHK